MSDANTVERDPAFRAYLRRIRGYPMLSADEERRLVARWSERGDRAAAERLVTSHLRLVTKIAARYRGYGLPLTDLIAEGNVGLLEALGRFDPHRGTRFAAYAVWWVEAAIRSYVLRSWSVVRAATTHDRRRLFFGLRAVQAKLLASEGTAASHDVRRLADRFAVRELEVAAMAKHLAAHDASLNVSADPDTGTEWQNTIVDDSPAAEALLAEREEAAYRRRRLSEALPTLSEREQVIVTERHLRDEPTPLTALAERYGVSPQRVQQIEARAVLKMRRSIATARRFGMPPRAA